MSTGLPLGKLTAYNMKEIEGLISPPYHLFHGDEITRSKAVDGIIVSGCLCVVRMVPLRGDGGGGGGGSGGVRPASISANNHISNGTFIPPYIHNLDNTSH